VQNAGVEGPLSNIGAGDLVLVDLSNLEVYEKNHIAGARHLPYASIVRSEPPVGGLLADQDSLTDTLNSAGIGRDSWVVAYDQSGGAAASRLIWTLHAFGFERCSLLDGGLQSWASAGFDVSDQAPSPPAIPKHAAKLNLQRHNVVNASELLDEINSGDELLVIDARSEKEFTGSDKRSERAGRIPGAKWQEWTVLLDSNKQLLDKAALEKKFADIGLSKRDDKRRIVVYCQTHQRSSLTYVVLKQLGFNNVVGLEGAWSAWGNRNDTPVEI